MPKVSIIIPVYNTEEYLRQCLDSVMNQTLSDIEVICVNDGSTDGSAAILQEYAKRDSRVVLIDQENAGAGAARNRGIDHSAGEYLYFCDSDDFCELNLLDLTVSHAENTQADIVVFNHYRYDSEQGINELRRGLNRNLLPEATMSFCYRDIPDYICSAINPTPWNKLYRAEFVRNAQLRFLEISTTNDITFAAMSAACAQRIVYLDEVLVHYRINHPGTITSTKSKRLDNVVRAVLGLYEQAQSLPYYDDLRNAVRRFVVSNLFFALEHYAGEDSSETYAAFYNEISLIFAKHPLFADMQYDEIRQSVHWDRFYRMRADIAIFGDSNPRRRLIASLTSFPARISTIHMAVETLLKQTMRPDEIILWLAEEQFPGGEQELPSELLKLKDSGLAIHWCSDLGSYKKLIPALERNADDIIITFDDDLLYDRNIIERLYKGFEEKPYCIQCHRITKVRYRGKDDIDVLPGAREPYPIPTYLHKLSGGAGCLYPPRCLHEDVTKKELFISLAPTSDDIWFWLMGALNGYKVNVVDDNICKLNYIPGTQDGDCLWKLNDTGEELFRVHFQNILEYYPGLQDLLRDESLKMQWLELASAIPQSRKNYDYYRALSPDQYPAELVLWYRRVMRRDLDLDNPRTYNEKIQWMKLYDSTSLKTCLADKYLVRDWVAEKVGEEYLIPLLGVWDSFDEINFDVLPDQFVLKANHGCGWNIVVKNKAVFNKDEAKKNFETWMETNFAYRFGLEMHYRDIVPRIIAERYLENADGDLYDYKFWCFNGEVRYVMFLAERNTNGLKMAFYDTEWNPVDITYSHPRYDKPVPRPQNLDRMIELASTLCQGFPHVRVDFYLLDDGSIKFGEMTFSSASGSCKWKPSRIDLEFGQLFTLPSKQTNIVPAAVSEVPAVAAVLMSELEKERQNHRSELEKERQNHRSELESQKRLLTGIEAKRKIEQKRWIDTVKSCRIGGAAAWLLRKIRGGKRVLKKHGWSYFWRRAMEYLGIPMNSKKYKRSKKPKTFHARA